MTLSGQDWHIKPGSTAGYKQSRGPGKPHSPVQRPVSHPMTNKQCCQADSHHNGENAVLADATDAVSLTTDSTQQIHGETEHSGTARPGNMAETRPEEKVLSWRFLSHQTNF